MGAIKNMSDRNVAFHSPDGKLHHVMPGDVFPEWAADKVSNPNVLGDQLAGESRSDESDSGEDSPRTAGVPPQSGRGSGIDAWRDYALDHDVDVQEDWTRERIIEECQKAGIPV